MTVRRDTVLLAIDDLVTSFTHYDRKDDEELPQGEIEAAVEAGEVTIEEMVAKFAKSLKRELGA